MVLTCPKCSARLQVDDAKSPAHAFVVRCPKCQTRVDVQPPAEAPAEANSGQASVGPEAPSQTSSAGFERPASAPPFKPRDEPQSSAPTPALGDLAQLLADALSNQGTRSEVGRKRAAWDHRKVLVCASPAYREVIAESLANNNYEVFVAENMAEGLGRMREERMDVVVLDANFDPVEQGVAFITREVRLLRPSQRRRLFFAYLTSGVRTMDPHAAFLQNVNLVVNPSEVDELAEALDISIRHYNDLY